MAQVLGSNPNTRTATVMTGITKLFVGEMVEAARVIMEERGDKGPIRPAHLREAFRVLVSEGKVPFYKKKRSVFTR